MYIVQCARARACVCGNSVFQPEGIGGEIRILV